MIYTHQTSKNSYFGSIISEPGTNNYLITNLNLLYSPDFQNTKSQILKISPTGTLLDSLNFNDNFNFSGPIIAYNNFYYCYGTIIKTYGTNNQSYFSTVYKIDLNLNIVKTAIIDTSYNDQIGTNRLIIKNNNVYIGNAHRGSSQLHFYKMDLNLIKKDSAIQQGSFLSDMINYGDKILASGFGFASGSVFGNNQVMELDTNFTVVSRYNLDSLIYINPAGCGEEVGITNIASNLYQISSNKYAVVGFFLVVNSASCHENYQNVASVIKNNSQVLNTKLIGSTFEDNLIITGGPASGSEKYNYIYTTSIIGYDMAHPGPPQTTPTKILVHKVDTSGNLIWAKIYKDTNMYYAPYGVLATPDSGVIVCGMRYNLITPAVPNACEGFVMKIDKNGNQVFVGIKENGNINVNYHKCYPNPATNKLCFDLPFQENVEITIYDVFGKQLLIETNYQNLSEINVVGLADGAYFYKIKTKQSNYSGKFIKE